MCIRDRWRGASPTRRPLIGPDRARVPDPRRRRLRGLLPRRPRVPRKDGGARLRVRTTRLGSDAGGSPAVRPVRDSSRRSLRPPPVVVLFARRLHLSLIHISIGRQESVSYTHLTLPTILRV